jgi:ABC-type multidrug transport system ATPase subunit
VCIVYTCRKILSCEISSTDGDCTVFGYSVKENPFAVRSMVGLCKQDDYLWPKLTAKEHLELFGGIRGVPSGELGSTVQTWLESVDLQLVQDDYTSTYSGGMKRRLSLALSTIGDRPFIILDEPTTGM